jgi:hypothetical protein
LPGGSRGLGDVYKRQAWCVALRKNIKVSHIVGNFYILH